MFRQTAAAFCHHVGCGGNGDQIHRHDSIRDAVFSAAQAAALAPRKEVPSLISGTLSRPADIFLPNRCDRHFYPSAAYLAGGCLHSGSCAVGG